MAPRLDLDFRGIHQTLHGYEEGHGLLCSSTDELDEAATSLMLVMSDLAPIATPTSGGWLTGYPLPSVDKYVIARTWPAPEKPRPGCVWTHSLILDYSAIASRQSLHTLINVLKRPSQDLSSYRVKIEEPSDSGPIRLPQEMKAEASAAIRRVYSTPAATAVVDCKDGREAELLALSVWEQQWPRLRRRFRWVTTAVRPSSEVKNFDLITDVGHEDNQSSIIEDNSGWIDAALADLTGERSSFRSDLRRLAIDVIQGRRAFPLLAASVVLITDKSVNTNEVKTLIDLFNNRLKPNEGAVARAAVLAALLKSSPKLEESSLAFALNLLPLISEGPESDQIAKASWTLDRPRFWREVVPAVPLAAAKAITQASIQDVSRALGEDHADWEFVRGIVPEVFTLTETWDLYPENKHDIFAICREDKRLLSSALKNAFSSGDLVNAIELVGGYDPGALLETYSDAEKEEWGSGNGQFAVEHHSWLIASLSDKESASEFIRSRFKSKGTLCYAARYLGIDSFPPNEDEEDVWLEGWNTSVGSSDFRDSQYLSAFHLYRSCAYKTLSRAKIFSRSASLCLESIEKSKLDDNQASAIISRYFTMYNPFNVFERQYTAVLRGLSVAVVSQSVPIGEFLADAKTSLAEDFVRHLQSQPGGRGLISRSMKASPASKKRRQLIEKILR